MVMVEKIRQLPAEWKKVNLGCNDNLLSGWINVDFQSFEGVDVVADLNQRWPWEDNSLDYIRAFDLVEHLDKPIHTMNEAYRVLGHGGVFEIFVPSTDGRGAFQDPTHVSFWNRNSFQYYNQRKQAKLYPGLIQCDFDTVVVDTQANADGIIWTWAFCRAIKEAASPLVIPQQWAEALVNGSPEKRKMPGYEGDNLGTIPVLVEG